MLGCLLKFEIRVSHDFINCWTISEFTFRVKSNADKGANYEFYFEFS